MTATELSASLATVVGERYRPLDVPVRGGTMRVAVWEPRSGDPQAPTIVAVHGITSSHVAWALVAQALPDVRIVAPDLRGRGGSRDLPAPYGMPSHADDVATVLDFLDVEQAVAVGHSMGAFVSLVLAHRHPEKVSSLVLVDGGMPLLPPPGVAPEDLASAVLGPAAERLEMTFPDLAAYEEIWRNHPAFSEWVDLTTAYVDYDLVPAEGGAFRPATRVEALHEDIRELVDGDSLLTALSNLRHPTSWLVAPRGLMDEVPPLYPDSAREHWVAAHPEVRMVAVEDVNHYTIVMLQRGVDQVIPLVREALAR
ncbi:alpha/beta fold hydrolase [Ornithinimicrobium cryptoxanthini]|uniref:Alpha/beta fold hydrolase n=1 Tax=Ornithinimicrobium cryptoxanthini TaxID=2934161 RepID=A0ABY4YLP7_9MICO|nr:alpha/beta hydrolase [Ornithinimicrobium cryptoxanthini]USQ77664.1 alpha/beta fold hydrolase [Ornithinimicrobium cryptoxanthini]